MPKTTVRHIALLVFNITILLINTLFWATFILIPAGLRLFPIPALQKQCQRVALWAAENWIINNNRLFKRTLPTTIKTQIPELSYTQSYLITSNHQSWVDIFVLQWALNRKAPFLRFFLKQQLIWIPIVGACWWALDFPFMKRYSKQTLQKRPELQGRDKQETIKRMQKLKDSPASIMLFLEGTRFTQAKHQRQQSPFSHLLKPKATGAAYALSVMSDKIDTLIDATIVYPNGTPTFTDYLMGKCEQIELQIEVSAIPDHLRVGDYEQDLAYKTAFQTWINQLWAHKNDLISESQHKN